MLVIFRGHLLADTILRFSAYFTIFLDVRSAVVL